jgi:hypothetical protein
MPQDITEQLTLEAATAEQDGSLLVEFITPGWGSSGYYSPQVVEAAAPLFAVGTHMYLDHPTPTEETERPVRSVKDLCAVITEAGVVNKATGGVRGKVKPFGPYKELILDEDFAKNIGLSIRASASDIVIGEAEGRKGPIIESLVDLKSVDFVTRAGRGGKVLQVLESATAGEVNARAIANGIEEATADERRQQLSDVIRTAYAGDKTYAWVRDFDESTVWFDASAENERSKTWQQAYTVAADDMSVALDGERTEVRPVTKYVPVTRPGSTTTTESEEDTMPNIEEAELSQLREASGRVPTLESERDTALQERDTAQRELAEHRRNERARTIVAERAHEHDVTFTPLEERGLLAGLPLTEAGDLDEAAFTTTVNENAAAAKAARGAGQVRGFGGSTITGDDISESDLDKSVAGAFGRQVKEA